LKSSDSSGSCLDNIYTRNNNLSKKKKSCQKKN
jgi:hypothetical protein